MAVSRRAVIAGLGGGAALVAAGGIWRVTRMPKTAAAPWTLGPPPDDIRLDAVRHAILAPNPHNRQPWLIRMEEPNSALLSCDLEKRLPETDPFDRQTMIGFGAFIEIASIAAAERGVPLVVEPFPEGEPGDRLDARPIARLVFHHDSVAPRDPLFSAIGRRRSNKEAYDLTKPIDEQTAKRLILDEANYTTDPARLAPLRELIVDAVTLEQRTPRTHEESVDLIRIGHAEIDANPDGIDLDGPMIEGLSAAGMIDRAQLADPGSTAFQSGIDMMRDTYGSIPALLWVATPGNTRADQLEAGRRYVRINLRAALLGLAMHPMSQSLQEYREMAGHFSRAHDLLGAMGTERVQMIARFGYAPPVPPSPRWPVEKHLVA